MQMFKKRIFGKETSVSEQGNFGYTNTLVSACGLPPTVTVYRNALYGNFYLATILATNVELTILAPAGYYSEFSSNVGSVISRYWDGTTFVGGAEVCA